MKHDNDYLSRLLAYHKLDENSPEVQALVKEGKKVEKLLQSCFEANTIYLKEGGSKAKGTMVRHGYDYDIAFYVDEGDTSLGETLDDISSNVEKCLDEGYTIDAKTIAIQLLTKEKDGKGKRIGIDVVVGRYVDGTRGDAYVAYRGSAKDRLKTNLGKHVAHVRYSGCTDVICLMKVLKLSRGWNIKTFPIELATIKLLAERNAPKSGLSERLYYVLAQLAEKADTIAIEDPSNPTGNNIDRVFGASERKLIKDEAKRAAYLAETKGWSGVFGEIPTADKSKLAAIVSAGTAAVTPVRAWSE